MHQDKIDHDLYRGTLDIVVLALIAQNPDHGYGIVERLRRRSEGGLEVSEGAIYPLLHRLESRSLITSEWRLTSQNRRAKHYAITEAGRKSLAARSSQWRELTRIVDDLISRIFAPGQGGAA